ARRPTLGALDPRARPLGRGRHRRPGLGRAPLGAGAARAVRPPAANRTPLDARRPRRPRESGRSVRVGERAVTRAVTAEQARRIAIRAQLLDGSARGVLDTVRRLGFLQLDPIATVAPPQHLVLWSRLGAFDTSELDRLLWAERKLFEWNAYVYPIESLPIVRAWI